MRWDAIIKEFWIFQDSEYARFLRMQALHKVLNMPGQRFTVLNKLTVLNMPGLWIQQGCGTGTL